MQCVNTVNNFFVDRYKVTVDRGIYFFCLPAAPIAIVNLVEVIANTEGGDKLSLEKVSWALAFVVAPITVPVAALGVTVNLAVLVSLAILHAVTACLAASMDLASLAFGRAQQNTFSPM